MGCRSAVFLGSTGAGPRKLKGTDPGASRFRPLVQRFATADRCFCCTCASVATLHPEEENVRCCMTELPAHASWPVFHSGHGERLRVPAVGRFRRQSVRPGECGGHDHPRGGRHSSLRPALCQPVFERADGAEYLAQSYGRQRSIWAGQRLASQLQQLRGCGALNGTELHLRWASPPGGRPTRPWPNGVSHSDCSRDNHRPWLRIRRCSCCGAGQRHLSRAALRGRGTCPRNLRCTGVTVDNIQTLVGLGADHILVPDMPDLGQTPEALAAGPRHRP